MTTISASTVKELRDKTAAGMMDCKEALKQSDGDINKAIDFLRKKGLATAAKRAGRAMSEGTIQTYIHTGGKLGVMVEVNCETDFVAKNEDFVQFARNIAMHIAATNPVSISQQDVPKEVVEKEMEIYRDQVRALCKRRHEKILLGGADADTHRPSLEQYDRQLLDQLIGIVAACAIVCYSIYTLWPDTVRKFGTQLLALTIPFVMFGIFRYLDLVYRREGGGRPEKTLLSDGPLLIDLFLYAAAVLAVFAWAHLKGYQP